MAFNKDQREFPLPGGSDDRRRSSRHLPRYFRTQANNKFLSSTFDQLIQPGVTEKLNGYIGRQTAPGYSPDDFYIGDVSKDREDYQLEPAAVVKDDLDNVQFYGDYNDYINQINNLDGAVKDHSKLNQQEYYSWNPHIDWDKFVNFREYYWLPNGPRPVPVSGDNIQIQSTYSVTSEDNIDNYAFIFSPDGLTQNPELTLYRGTTYRFEIDSPGIPISFRSTRVTAAAWSANTRFLEGETVVYESQIYTATATHRSGETFEEDRDLWFIDTSLNLVNEVSQQGVENGIVELTLFPDSPNFIYYVSDADINAGGLIRVYNEEEASFIDVEQDIIGKRSYTTGNGFDLSNGMKIYFQGTTAQAKYQQGSWYVEGVGSSITLISEDDLNISSAFVEDTQIDFDTEGFDTVPYSRAIGFPRDKDYFTINRSSRDGNLWSKYNRWFHRDVIDKAAEITGVESSLDQNARAARPIIEFEAGVKLFNFGTGAKQSVDLVDDFTKDIFSTIEGSEGYNIDGVDLTNGMRILFTADTDVRVSGKIYTVEFILFKGQRQIALREAEDAQPFSNETVLCKQGATFSGKILYYTGVEWELGQQKNSVNQEPLFDVFDCEGNSLADPEVYQSSSFAGTKIFSYSRSQGFNDPELGFPLAYRSIQNVGDIVFDFNLSSDAITFCPDKSIVLTESTGIGYLKQFQDRETFQYVNGWKKAEQLSQQYVIRQFVAESDQSNYPIDVYDNSAELEDLVIKVFVNNKLKQPVVDYSVITNAQNQSEVLLPNLEDGDVIQIKTRSNAVKNENGKYEIAINLERNPLNDDVQRLTLGEINDHVGTIIEDIEDFEGKYPGLSNLRDQGEVSQFGRRIVKHSAPLNLALYHLLDEDANLVKSLQFARQEYGKFKRNFLRTSFDLAFDGPINKHFDQVMRQITKEKPNTDPFYFSDMVATGAKNTTVFEIDSADQEFFGLSDSFNLENLSERSVLVYLNGVQLIHGKDYIFNDEGFVVLFAAIDRGDELVIDEFESTNGSFVPATPTKLGLYPKFIPQKFVDDTYIEPRTVIQGHDGSLTLAFDDFRDDLILELEKRIYNNIKVEYDSNLFDVLDYIPSVYRNTGITRDQIDQTMISDFVQWTRLVNEDYTENTSYNRDNSFTWNYTGSSNFNNQKVKGRWRQVYQAAYDTDRPHSHPWEMLGYSIKPSWWNEQYGEAPYTSNNLLMWEDIEKGIVREPGKNFIQFEKYKRPGLVAHLPVDDRGNLLSPLQSNYIKDYNTSNLSQDFVYGDWSPVETAWRKSSEYPFAILGSLFVNQPARTMSVCFDRTRQQRGLVDDIIYEKPNRQIRLQDIVFPNSIQDNERIFTAGFVNYIRDYVSSSVTRIYETYKNNLRNIDNQIGAKLAGFTTKEKFKLILDSRTPFNEGNVFVPEENYQIFLNTSTPIKTVYYSGVIVEKQGNGFVIRGYNEQQPYFEYTPPRKRNQDPIVSVGGISATSTDWVSNITLTSGTIVNFRNSFYRVTTSHVSGNTFDEDKFTKLPRLPVEGGREAAIRQEYLPTTEILPYGTVLKDIQDVVDFILGYGNWLETQGFVFDYYEGDTGLVADWITATKEYLFWTTQNWSKGSVISLSPAAFKLKVESQNSIVGDIYDTFYGYSLLKVDGKKFQPEFVSLTREEPGEFVIKPKATEDGIFGVRVSFVQKEHALIIDNRTQFGDIIYDQPAGYRQERIRVLGYRTGEWDGSVNIPGFIFDEVKIEDWQPWRDYVIGDLVRYKEFFYAARTPVTGTAVFDSQDWSQLSERPESGIIPNFEYKTNQFADFYDLDTDNFDSEQQKFAQHLIGYQNRDYLANIINDEVSQYKFYQGFIQDKGTANAFTKLFDALGSANRDSLEFYEEWAIKSGQYGAADGFKEVEYILDESQFRASPQPIKLTDRASTGTELVYRILPNETYLKPEDYNHAPFPEKSVTDTFVKNSGYVNPDDVDFTIDEYRDILNLDLFDLKFGSKIWVGNENNTWNIYTVARTDLEVEAIESSEIGYDLSLSTTDWQLDNEEIIGLYNVSPIDGLYQIDSIENNIIKVRSESQEQPDVGDLKGKIVRLVSSRFTNATEVCQNTKIINQGLDRLWIDNTSDAWRVIDRNMAFSQHETITSDFSESSSFGSSIDSNRNNTVLAVGDPDNENGKVYIYTRANNSGTYKLATTLEIDDEIASPGAGFGSSVAVSQDGNFVAVGSPKASNVKSRFSGTFSEDRNYKLGSIVQLNDNFWKSETDIAKAQEAVELGSYESVLQILIELGIADSNSNIPVLLAGNYPFENQSADHFIVRAPRDMYDGSSVGDTVELKWNSLSYAYQDNQDLETVEPFLGTISQLDSDFITNNHVIAEKIDSILYVELATNIPDVGQIVETQSASGTVAYVYNDVSEITIYVTDQNGEFDLEGSLTTGIGEFVGEYESEAALGQIPDIEEYWGGFWKIDVQTEYDVFGTISDNGRGLVYTNLTPQGDAELDIPYFNVLDFESDEFSSFDTRYTEIANLTYEGLPGPDGETGVFESNLYVLRAPKPLTDQLSPSENIEVFYNDLPNSATGSFIDTEQIGISTDELNRTHTIFDLWDGYIDYRITKFFSDGSPIEPKVGITVQDITNEGTAEVAFYQKFDSLNARIYVKNVDGVFALGRLFGENREIQFLGDGSNTDFGVNRVFGQIESRSLGYAPDSIGKLIVFGTRDGENIELQNKNRITIKVSDDPRDNEDLPDTDIIATPEYWFYQEEIISGAPREPNIPADNNNDWRQVYRIPADSSGAESSFENEGLFTVFTRTGSGQYTKIDDFIVPQRDNNIRLGEDVKFADINNLTKLFVKAAGNSDSENFGKIFVIKNGEENENLYSWEIGRDKDYTGEFDIQRQYFRDNVVFLDEANDNVSRGLYRAKTNLIPGEFDNDDWNFIEDPIDYLGFVPNSQGLVLEDFSTVSDIGDLTEFSRDFDVSENGEILVTSSFYNDTQPNRLVIYRNQNGLYVRDQEIQAPSNTDDFGNSISITNDGLFLAVGAPLDDTNGLNQGAVFVYQQVDGEFVLSQILTSSNDDKNEQFGYRVDFSTKTLAVTSRNGDSFSEAIFDSGDTIFDRNLTKFRDYEDDAGIVQIYELFDNSLLYAQTIDFDDSGVKYFGRNLSVVGNHIYIGMPQLEYLDNAKGTVVDYRKKQNSSLWKELRRIKPTVDVSKIKKVSLYDTRKNELIQYLDYIDPLQGKIAGIAEQEISYKLYYDPAVYTEGTEVQIDRTNSWGELQVGEIWWDLSNTKFLNPYQSEIIYSANNWSTLFSDQNSVDVFEWVEADILPSEWDRLSGTEQGFTRGITGTTRYGDSAYVSKRLYNKASQTFSTKFYYWVRNKSTVPNIESRKTSAQDIADLIRNPQGEGYRYVSLISPTEFALYNCESLIKDRDVAISFQYYTIDDQSINIHNQYQIITDGLASSRPNRDIEQKWFDSLVGYDLSRRQVPAPELSVKEKYGILNTPRQGWFVNRIEALKETVERINRVLVQNLIVDEKDISRLTEQEQPPSITTRLYDRTVESEIDLEFVGVARARQAKLSVQTENGKVIRVEIVDPGRGYLVPPTVSVLGTGTGAEIEVEIDNQGRITNAEVLQSGEFYQKNTSVNVRRFTVLVENDSTIDGRWALYERDAQSREWNRTQSQGFNVSEYWTYIDWYEKGSGQFTDIDYLIDAAYELQSLNDEIGNVVKIQNIGTGGWLLLEKINDEENVDYTVNYKTIGRQKGTLQFLDTLYDITQNLSGFDTTTFDSENFDSLPTIETRIILETIRDDLFTDDLEVEYNKLFFASLRYVFSEQNFVDWAFKTSFIKAQHNVGQLEQKISFQNDNLPSYEDYVEEVKPYSANIREYLSTYENLENSRSMTTDFDLPPRYDFLDNSISPLSTKVKDNSVTVEGGIIDSYPDLHWLDSVGFSIDSITVSDKGEGYTSAPTITLSGGGGTGAKARASIGTNGVLSQITVTDKGQGYISAPQVIINGSLSEDGKAARAVAKIGGSPIRNMHSVIKFDRVSGEFEFVNLRTVEQFAGTGNRLEYDLEWPMDLRTTRVRVFVNGSEALGGLYTYENALDISKGYDRQQGKIIFDQAPSNGALIEVEYFKSINLLKAQDRINSKYDPTVGKLGKSLGQLMDGIDYGGVEVTSFGFESTSGWDSQPWGSNFWDVFDTTFEDEIIVTKELKVTFDSPVSIQAGTVLTQDSTGASGIVKDSIENETDVIIVCDILDQFDTTDVLRLDDSSILLGVDSTVSVLTETTTGDLVLDKPLESNTVYNVYKVGRDSQGEIVSNIRLDDPNYGTTDQTNDNAIMASIIGDGSTSVLSFDELDLQDIQKLSDEDLITIIVRKIDSDGSFIPDPESYDTDLSGGDLAYQTATGIKAEEINIDGDGFVTTTTSKGPEEVVPGQVLDTLDMRVYETPVDGRSRITSRNYIANGVNSVYNSGTIPIKSDNVFVKIDNIIQDSESYQIDYRTGDIVLDSVPAANARINITTLGNSGSQILDIDNFTGDGKTGEFLTNVKYAEDIEAFITVNGKEKSFRLLESTNDYDIEGNVVVKFNTPPAVNSAINVMLITEDVTNQNYSVVEIDDFTGDGSSSEFVLENNIFEQQPAQAYTIVKVNDTILNAGYNELFEVSNLREYQIDLTQIPVATVSANEIEVYLNGNLLERNSQWRFEGSGAFTVGQSQPGSTIILENGIGKPGDELRVYVLTNGEYRFGYFDSANEFIPTRGEDSTLPVLHLDTAPESGSKITIYNFSNHDSQGIERISLEVTEKTPTTPETKSYYDFRRLQRGIVDLRKSAENVQSVWVIMNNELLTGSIDYYLREDKTSIQIVRPTVEGDKIEIIHFANDPITETFGWRQFKDMLNRTHYKRLSKSYKLASNLQYDDLEIIVEDASELPEPNYNTSTPGVIFLDKERIEYFVKDGNTLKQLRRGTLGTGIADNYPAGTEFMEQGKSHNIPYNDETEIITETAGGYSEGISEFGNNIGLSIDTISYDFNNNTAFPLGGQVTTVIGTGFEENVAVQVGEVECETTYISSTELTFITPALPVGAYDLVVINPTTNIPVFRPQTSVVGEGLIKYVQILLPFAPLPETDNVQNPAETGEWYTEDFDEGGIPDDYWQALDIDVFVGGKRLNKSPAEVYNYEGQDSPEGDKTIQAEFAVNKNVGAYVRLTEPPPKGSIVKIVRKTGTRWSEEGKPLARSETDVARFLQSSTTDLPR